MDFLFIQFLQFLITFIVNNDVKNDQKQKKC